MGNPYRVLNLPGIGWPDRRETTDFSIHHTVTRPPADDPAAELDSIMAVHNYHRDVMAFGGHGYHAACFESGRWWLVNANTDIARAGVGNRNTKLYHIAAYGTYSNSVPPDGMLYALSSALEFARDRYGDKPWGGHRDYMLPGFETTCPGNKWQEWVPTLGQEEEDMSPEDREWFELIKNVLSYVRDGQGNVLTGIDALKYVTDPNQGWQLLEGQRQLYIDKHRHEG
jgi:hypothetical protein